MSAGQLLGSETGLTIVTAVLGSIWTALQGTNWFRQARDRRYAKALQALEAGVEVTYRTYVKAIKDSREDGKLTNEEVRQAQQRALAAAIDFGKTQGLDVVRELGGEYIDILISKLVKKLKS